MDEEPAQFDADVFLGKWLVGQVGDDVVAVLKSAGAGARRNSKLVTASGPRQAESCGDSLAWEDRSPVGAVVGRFDAVVQNPPFGVQKRTADRRFLEKALSVADVVYSLHNHPVTDRQLIAQLRSSGGNPLKVEPSSFLNRFVEEHGGRVEAVYAVLLAIPRMFDFHTRDKHEIAIDLYVIKKERQ